MKIAYLFLVHQNPKLVGKAIHRLTTPGAAFFIHVDAKVDIGDFTSIRGENICFTKKRVPVFWGEFSQVEAMLILIHQALSSIDRYDYFVLLSGSDYPLQSGRYIRAFFETHRGTEFMSMVKAPNEEAGKPLSRLTTLRFPSTRPLLRFIFRILAKLNLATRDYRNYFGDFEPYMGSTWWALSRAACQHIVDFNECDHRLADFFMNTFASDEAFFHTILGNSRFKLRMQRNLWFEDWSACTAHPSMINERHLAVFEQQRQVLAQDIHGSGELLFARKFSDANLRIVERLDEVIERKEHQFAGHGL